MRTSTIAWGLVVTFTTAGVAWSQTLADAARKAEERRKSVAAPSKLYTNGDLRPVQVTPPDPATQPAEAKPAAGDKPAGETVADAKGATPSIDQGEDYWRKLMGDARAARARSDTYLDALQNRIEQLTSDFNAQQDPALRNALWTQRARVIDDMERLKQEMADQDAAIAKIEEDARKANIPPGWIR